MQETAYLKIPAAKLKAGALTTEQRQMIVYQALMSGLAAVAGVVGPAGERVTVADDGSETRSVGENSWAYGVERYEVITQRLPDGALRVRTRKTETVNATPPAGPDDMFSTEDDRRRACPNWRRWAAGPKWWSTVAHGSHMWIRRCR